MTKLTSLEYQVIQMLLAGDDEVLAVLREQAKDIGVSSRKMTGVGVFTELVVPSKSERVPGRLSFKLGDVGGTATNLNHGLGFLLYVTDGAITMLECYTYDEPWPDEIHGLALAYFGGQSRNLDKLRKVIRCEYRTTE